MIVLPALILVIGQGTGALLLDTKLVVLIGLALLVLDLVLLWQVLRHLDRTRLFESQVR